jgi:hypothetical protein
VAPHHWAVEVEYYGGARRAEQQRPQHLDPPRKGRSLAGAPRTPRRKSDRARMQHWVSALLDTSAARTQPARLEAGRAWKLC